MFNGSIIAQAEELGARDDEARQILCQPVRYHAALGELDCSSSFGDRQRLSSR